MIAFVEKAIMVSQLHRTNTASCYRTSTPKRGTASRSHHRECRGLAFCKGRSQHRAQPYRLRYQGRYDRARSRVRPKFATAPTLAAARPGKRAGCFSRLPDDTASSLKSRRDYRPSNSTFHTLLGRDNVVSRHLQNTAHFSPVQPNSAPGLHGFSLARLTSSWPGTFMRRKCDGSASSGTVASKPIFVLTPLRAEGSNFDP